MINVRTVILEKKMNKKEKNKVKPKKNYIKTICEDSATMW